jgi:alkylation response protein AidB-like acyl-CoA dehydrogenase
MGLEIPADYGGSGASFTSVILAVEELSKIDPSVATICDLHNTLVSSLFLNYASKELQDKYMPQLATETVNHTTIH